MEYIVWVGPRDSDIKYSKYFSDSICYYSQNNYCNIRKAHIYGKFFIDFVETKMIQILSVHKNAKFVFYNPKIAYNLDAELMKHVLCLNPKYILHLLSDKIYTRYWLGNYVPVLPSLLLDSHNLSFKSLSMKLGFSNAYIVQQNKSSGGFGTFYLSNDNESLINNLRTNYNELFIISPYIKNSISINVNAIIYNQSIKLFAPSLQIVENNQNRLLYHGADYKAFQMFSDEIIEKINENAKIILKMVQKLGYRGIIGIDFILEGDRIYFQEINPRFQASSFLIDEELYKHQLPSIAEMNTNAFYADNEISYDTEKIQINTSFYKYIYANNARHLYHVESIASKSEYVKALCLDGWKHTTNVENDAYCYSIIFSTNITSPNLDGNYNLYSNIGGEEEFLSKHINTLLGLKIALINQGCVINEDAKTRLKEMGILKNATFSAIDFQLTNGLHINTPVNLKFTEFTPFIIGVNSNRQLILNYYEMPISTLQMEMQPKWTELKTQNDVSYSRIAYLSTDRLRIKHEFTCDFKKNGKGCTFCSIPNSIVQFNDNDLKEVIEYLIKEPSYRHILIGGGSGNLLQEHERIVYITQLIRNNNKELPIYLMSLPPNDKRILELYKEVGITEIAFNIEIWDRALAKQLMPGKGQIPLENYLDMLKEGTKLWGTNGNVRAALIVGLNSEHELLDGITTLCESGIQPMLSVFRPMPKTKLESLVPPSNSTLLSIFLQAQYICHQNNLELGPTCDACKNNMLAI